jgi:aerobic-type carbon monoxide dehydrogenase small subunit (CoxS/CutS family)
VKNLSKKNELIMVDRPMLVKVALGADLRRIPVPEPDALTFASLCSTLYELFPSLPEGQSLAVQYVDDEGDKIVASSDTELWEAFRVAKEDERRSLRLEIILVESLSSPQLETETFVVVSERPTPPEAPSMIDIFKREAEKSMADQEGVISSPPVTTSISFTLNGEHITVHNPDPRMRLITYLREETRFTGTKISCGEGGCGACTVMLTSEDGLVRSVNACLRPLIACDGQTVTTTEGIGQKNNYHPVQKALAEGFGLQCGFCTPGMVMAMYALMQEKGGKKPTQQEVEDRFDGNICRCTGYRPILQSFRKLAEATDATAEAISSNGSEAGAMGGCCGGHNRDHQARASRPPLSITHVPVAGSGANANSGAKYYRCASLADVLALKSSMLAEGTPVQTMCGNTSAGVYQSLRNSGEPGYDDYVTKINTIIDVSSVAELLAIKEHDTMPLMTTGSSTCITFGSAVPISQVMQTLEKAAAATGATATTSSFTALLAHMKRIASYHVRNVGSWTGNFVMAREKGK